MKKLLFLLALLLGMVACQNDYQGLDVDANGEAAVTLNVTLPDGLTRAAGADSATGAIGNVDMSGYDIRFILEVYDENNELAKERIVNYEDTATSTSFSLRLIPGRGYKFVAWADFVKQGQKGDYHYNTAAGLTNVAVNTATWKAMDESRDAYTTVEEVTNFSSAASINLTLTRPFAKLRVVATDIKELYGDLLPKDVKVVYNTEFYTSYNALTKVASDKAATTEKDVDLSVSTYSDEQPKNDGKMTLFADYMLADVDASPIQFTMDIVDNSGKPIPTINFNTAIPIQRNHLTTISGYILTDANNIKVTINDAFDVPAEDVYVWDGKSVKEPKHNGENGDITTATEFYIEQGSELAWLADQVNGTTRAAANNFAGKTIMLTKDVNLGGNRWTPIGLNGDASNKFNGTFDGDNHVITNLVVNTEAGYTAAGLFGALNGTAKNFTIDGANIKHISTGNQTVNGIAVVAGSLYNRGNVENVTVKNAIVEGNRYVGGIAGYVYGNIKNCVVDGIVITVTPNKIANGYDNGDKAGAIAGYFGDESVYYVSGNIAKNFTVQAYRDLGGIVGCANKGAYVKDNVAENGTLIVNQKTNYYGEKDANAGYIVGRIVNGSLGTGNAANNVSVGKFIGAQKAFDAARALEQESVVVELTADVTLKGTTGENFAKANTITIDGQGHKLTYTDSYRTYVEMAEGGKVIYKNLKLYRETTNNSTHWHDNNMKFCCDAEFYNVEFNKGICFDDAKTFVLNNSAISKNKVATYALFIVAGCNVSIDGLTVTCAEGLGGRGIKIVDEDAADKDALTTLSVSNSKFTTTKKAAILVGSRGGAKITLANNDITEVAEDTVNTVWVDVDYKAYANNVSVTGGLMTIEGVEATVSEGYADAVKVENATVVLKEGTYAALANVANGVTIFGNGSVIEGSSKIAGENVTIKNVTFTNSGSPCFNSVALKGTKFEGCTFEDDLKYCYAGETVVFEKCVFNGSDYAIHFDSNATGFANTKVVLKDCVINSDWRVAIGAAISMFEAIDCKFNVRGFINMHGKATLTNCEFNKPIYWIANADYATYTDCKYEGRAITADDLYIADTTVSIDGKCYSVASSDDTFKTAIENSKEGDTIIISDDTTIDFTKVSLKSGVTIKGGENSVISLLNASNYITSKTNVTFENVKFEIKGDGEYYNRGIENGGYSHEYIDCTFTGIATNWGNNTYTRCTFTNDVKGKYAAWVYSGSAKYDNCTINGVDRAAKVYTEAGATATAEYIDCTFNAQQENKTAVEIDASLANVNYNVTITNATISNMGDAETWGTKYFNIEGTGAVVNHDGVIWDPKNK